MGEHRVVRGFPRFLALLTCNALSLSPSLGLTCLTITMSVTDTRLHIIIIGGESLIRRRRARS